MRKYFSIVLLLIFNCSLISCKSNDESVNSGAPTSVDVSISSSENIIYWTSESDITLKLISILSFDTAGIEEERIEKAQNFNTEMTEVTASIDFRGGYKSVYKDSDTSNNSVIIKLVKEVGEPSKGVQLKADGSGNTYELITAVLAPNYNPIETPDCGHDAFGNHIDELFDADLNSYVFRFYIHANSDNDRCKNFDRQRNEIKTYDRSPDNLLGVENEKVIYKWKFKLPTGFQSSSNFTHIHQIKSVGGDLESMPMYTLTTRKSTPDKIELRYAETDSQVTLIETALAPFIGKWVEVTETILYGTSGTYEIVIKSVEDETVLLSYVDNSIINWRLDAEFARPKWGIYRSLINVQDLRDEELLFADFSIEELE